MKRLDLLYPEAPGNKYFKLKYNLLKAKELGATTIVTLGGPFSNHLHATAATCKQEGFKCVGLVHGTRPPKLSPTLKDCEDWGMELVFIERSLYAERETEGFKHWVSGKFERSFLIPEGGNNFHGMNGCMEILNDHDKTFKTIAVSVGTGTTLAGVLSSSLETSKILAFPALKDMELSKRTERLLYWSFMDEGLAKGLMERVQWVWDYTFGGFAKTTPELEAFMHEKNQRGLPLDRVYTSKMIFGLEDMAKKGLIAEDERVLAIHTGGLQGNRQL